MILQKKYVALEDKEAVLVPRATEWDEAISEYKVRKAPKRAQLNPYSTHPNGLNWFNKPSEGWGASGYLQKQNIRVSKNENFLVTLNVWFKAASISSIRRWNWKTLSRCVWSSSHSAAVRGHWSATQGLASSLNDNKITSK